MTTNNWKYIITHIYATSAHYQNRHRIIGKKCNLGPYASVYVRGVERDKWCGGVEVEDFPSITSINGFSVRPNEPPDDPSWDDEE